MKRHILNLFLFATLFLFPRTSNAQSQNALDFDGIDDQVVYANGSALIANSNEISMTCWVYPTNANPMYPDFDGFAGIRNDADGDFYMVQIGPSTVEARFRNSLNQPFEVVFPNLVLNTWQHLAMTYDGSYLVFYYNGSAYDSIAASGNITNTGISFLVGNVQFTSASFLLTGKIDETSFWNKALSASDIACIYSSSISPNDPNLKLYFKYDQGIAGGNNGTITTVHNFAGATNGALTGFALAGATSNWVAGVVTNYIDSATVCSGSSYTFGTQVLTAPGVYIEGFPTSGGCDSIVELFLSSPLLNTVVIQTGPSLTSQQSTGTWQWVDCNNNFAPIPGAINKNYVATANGSYAVIVSQGGCSDTSVCVNVVNVGLNSTDANNLLQVTPNPAKDFITLSYPKSSNLVLDIFDVTGKKLMENITLENSKMKLNIQSFPAGLYYIRIRSENTVINKQFIKY